MRSTRLFSGVRTSSTVARQSTCPDSTCPPTSAPSFAARSTLTRPPSASAPSVVSASVCAIRSKLARSLAGRAVTVRHAPSHATLAPIARSWSNPGGSSKVRLRSPGRSVIDATRATPWTMPVNMDRSRRWRRQLTSAEKHPGAARARPPVSTRLRDLHRPGVGARLQVLPGEGLLALGFDLVVQRLGIVVVGEDEGLARLQLVEGTEAHVVPLRRRVRADVELLDDFDRCRGRLLLLALGDVDHDLARLVLLADPVVLARELLAEHGLDVLRLLGRDDRHRVAFLHHAEAVRDDVAARLRVDLAQIHQRRDLAGTLPLRRLGARDLDAPVGAAVARSRVMRLTASFEEAAQH